MIQSNQDIDASAATRMGGKSVKCAQHPLNLSQSTIPTGLVIEGIEEPWIDTSSPRAVFSFISKYSEFLWVDDSPPTPSTIKVCFCPAN
jgi:hypothetical protein